MQRFRGGLVFKAHRLLYHSTLGLIVKKKRTRRYTRRGGMEGAVASDDSENSEYDDEFVSGMDSEATLPLTLLLYSCYRS